MAVIINHTAEIIKSLEKQGKVRIMNTPEDLAAFKVLSDRMQEARREYLIKEAASWESAAKIVFNA